MKRVIFCGVFTALCWSAFAYSQIFFSMGPALGIDRGTIESADFSMTGIALNVNLFRFWDWQIGMYGNISIGKPLSLKIDNKETSTNEAFTSETVFGQGYYIPFSEKMDLKIGAGLHVSATFLGSLSVFAIGIRGTVALYYIFGRRIFLDAGSSFAYDFFGDSGITHSAFDIRPYIAIGVIIDKWDYPLTPASAQSSRCPQTPPRRCLGRRRRGP